jgi:hypothetical protein
MEVLNPWATMIRDLMIGGASVEDTLTLWASSLRDAKQRIRPLFTQERVAASAGQFLDGLLGNEQRKTGWMRAEAAGDAGPWRQQAILGRGQWDADALRDIVHEYALETLGDEDAVLVIDETGFLKQGKASCGVARQYTGSAGKITNCQIGVFACYVSRHGHAFIDRALYLPKEWTDDPARLKEAHVPSDVGFATKPKIARRMIARAIAAKVPFSFVAADSVYGTGEVSLRRCSRILPFGQTGRDGPGPVLRVSSSNSRTCQAIRQDWSLRHKAQLEECFAELLARSGADRPNELARAVWLLSEGAVSLILVHGDRGYSAAASEAAITLVRHYLKK